jgi:SAM-dependent methyltransferase
VTSPERMLREARRVLRDGGVAAFSVWGRPENAPFWTLLPVVQKELGIGTCAVWACVCVLCAVWPHEPNRAHAHTKVPSKR